MKEYIIRMPEESEEVLTAVIEKFGAEIELVNRDIIAGNSKAEKKIIKNKKDKKVSPTYLFGAWKELDIDPVKIRKEAWDRSHKF